MLRERLSWFTRRRTPLPESEVLPAEVTPSRPNPVGLLNRMITEIGGIEHWPARREIAMANATEYASQIALASRRGRRKVRRALNNLKTAQINSGRTNGVPDQVERLLREAQDLV